MLLIPPRINTQVCWFAQLWAAFCSLSYFACPQNWFYRGLQEDSTSSCPPSLNFTKTQTKQVTGVQHRGMNKIRWHKQCRLFSPQFSKISIFTFLNGTALQCGFGSWSLFFSFLFFFFTYFCPRSLWVVIWFPLLCVVLTISTALRRSNKTPCTCIELGWRHAFHTRYLCTRNQSNLHGELTH